MLLFCLLCFTLYLISQFWTQTTLFKCISPIYCPYNIAYHGSHIHSQKLPAVDLPRVCDRATLSCLKNLNTISKQKLEMIMYPALTPFVLWQGLRVFRAGQ